MDFGKFFQIYNAMFHTGFLKHGNSNKKLCFEQIKPVYSDERGICVPCCHNQPKVGNDFLELVSSSDAEEKELSSKSKIVCL